MPIASDPADELKVPLWRWADRQLARLAKITDCERLAALDGQTLLAERGSAGDYVINGKVSAGIGGSRLMQTRDGGWFALTIIRREDRDYYRDLLSLADIDQVLTSVMLSTEEVQMVNTGQPVPVAVEKRRDHQATVGY